MKKKLKKLGQKLAYVLMMTSVLITQCAIKVQATGFKNTKLYKGTMAMFKDGEAALLLVEASFIVILEIKTGIKYQQAEDDEKRKYKKEAKSTLMAGILIMTISSLIPVVFGYYK